MKILTLAFECNPEWPSLPAVAYKYAVAMAEKADVTLVTLKKNKENIEKAGRGRLKVEYIDVDYIAKPLDRIAGWIRGGNGLGWTTQVAFNYPIYLAFELAVWRRYRKALARGVFDIIHRSTPMTPTLPSPMAKWSKVPFVIGPLNGGLPWPKPFGHIQKQEKEWLRPLRQAYKYMPYHHTTMAKASCILSSFDHTINDLPAAASSKIIDFPEVGLDPNLFFAPNLPQLSDDDRAPLKVLFASRLVPCKLPEVVIGAFAKSKVLRNHKLIIVGDGPEKEKMEQMIVAENLESNVEMLGWQSQAKVGEMMRNADIFLFPSIKDLGAGALLEGMASGMACVALDYGAPSTLIKESTGIKVPVGSINDMTTQFIEQLEMLVHDRERLKSLGQSAKDYVLPRFTWSAKADKTLEIFRWVLDGKKSPRPSFWN